MISGTKADRHPTKVDLRHAVERLRQRCTCQGWAGIVHRLYHDLGIQIAFQGTKARFDANGIQLSSTGCCSKC